MDPPVILPPNIEDVPPPGLALVEELDKLLLVQVGPLEQAGNRHRPWPPVPPAACCLLLGNKLCNKGSTCF